MVLLLSFFLSASFLTKIGHKQKKIIEDGYKKGNYILSCVMKQGDKEIGSRFWPMGDRLHFWPLSSFPKEVMGIFV